MKTLLMFIFACALAWGDGKPTIEVNLTYTPNKSIEQLKRAQEPLCFKIVRFNYGFALLEIDPRALETLERFLTDDHWEWQRLK